MTTDLWMLVWTALLALLITVFGILIAILVFRPEGLLGERKNVLNLVTLTQSVPQVFRKSGARRVSSWTPLRATRR